MGNLKVKDGIIHRGLFGEYSRSRGNSVSNWRQSSRRYLFITKELYFEQKDWLDIRQDGIGNKEENWDCVNKFLNGERVEDKEIESFIDRSRKFYPNYINLLYGLEQSIISKGVYPKYKDWSRTKDAFLFFLKDSALARINCSKVIAPESVGTRTTQSRLKEIIDKNLVVLKRQIRYLDPDIIVCCGNQGGSNLIKTELVDKVYKDSEEFERGIYYTSQSRKIIIDSYHLSYPSLSPQDFYEDIVKHFARFIRKHPDFRIFR